MLRFLEPLFHLCWPVSCPVCGRLGVIACPECLDSVAEAGKPLCLFCFRPLPCRVHGNAAPFLVYGSAHRGMAKALVHGLKYEGRKALGRQLGQALARKTALPEGLDFIVPVPLHKRSERPYNQALELARGMAETWRLPVADVLKWAVEGKRQVEKTARERKILPEGAVVFSGRHESLSGKKVLLVDDVCTTGTTLRRCAEAIRQAGGIVPGAVVWTRVPDRE